MALDSIISDSVSVTHNWASHDSHSQLWIIQAVNTFVLSGSIALFGICTNVINLAVFYKQGLSTSINISFFVLAASDLGCLLCHEAFVVFAFPLFRKIGLPIVYEDVQFLSTAMPRVAFARYSCLVTLLITTERCICIIFPQIVHVIVTPFRVTLVLVFIGIGNLVAGMPIYVARRLDWIFYHAVNKTLFGIVTTNINHELEKYCFIANAILLFFTVTSVVVSSAVLVVKLKQASAWRRSATINYKYSLSKRETTAKSMVLLIACILIVCYTPSVLLCIITFCEPEFTIRGRYDHMYETAWSFAFLLETINSSVNIFVYFSMSAKYRHTLKTLFKMEF